MSGESTDILELAERVTWYMMGRFPTMTVREIKSRLAGVFGDEVIDKLRQSYGVDGGTQ